MNNEITEAEIRTETMIVLQKAKHGFITTSDLIDILTQRMNPTGHDAEILDGRLDTHFSQKVRNLVSHRNQGSGLSAKGLAIYDETLEGWRLP